MKMEDAIKIIEEAFNLKRIYNERIQSTDLSINTSDSHHSLIHFINSLVYTYQRTIRGINVMNRITWT